MSLCVDCGKTLASPVGLRRHINSQHQRSEWHVCECGKQFLDPAARSRCRAGHLKSFACPLQGCYYQSTRKDCVKQHIRRRHRNFMDPQVLTLPQGAGSSRHSSNDDGLGLKPTPPQDIMLTNTFIFQPQPCPWQSQWPFYYPGMLPGSWAYSG